MKRPNLEILKRGGGFLIAVFNSKQKVFDGPRYVGTFDMAEKIFGYEDDWPVREERLNYRLNARFADSRIADKNGY